MTAQRGLRVIPVSAALVLGLMKGGSDGFWPGIDVPDDLEIIDVRLARHAHGDPRIMMFVASATFDHVDDIKAMHGHSHVPSWEPRFARRGERV